MSSHSSAPAPSISGFGYGTSTTWTHKLQEKPSALYREQPALQNMKILYFFPDLWVILPSWIRIRIQNVDPDSDQQNNFIRIQWIWIWNQGCGSGFAWIRINLSAWIRIQIHILNENPDPDPEGQKWPATIEKRIEFSCFEVLYVLFWGLKASNVSCITYFWR
jgi:hypothetical protein